MTELVERSAVWMARAVREGEVAAVELFEAHAARIADRDPEINALVLPGLDEARAEAVAADDALARGEAAGPLHGYAIAQRIHTLSREELSVEEGSLYPALQKLLLKGWVKASPAISETGRAVREYKLTPAGRKQLELERANYRRVTTAIGAVLDTA